MNYYNFIKTIKTVTSNNSLVNEFGEGDIYEHLNSGEHKYPCVFLTVQTVVPNNDMLTINGTLFYVDRMLTNAVNKNEIISNGITILSQIFQKLLEDTVVMDRVSSFTPFDEKFADICAGVFASFSATIPNDIICSDSEFEVRTITLNHNGIYDIIGYDQAVVAVEGGVWGQITGDINEQTDLMTLINSKQNNLTAGTNIKIEGDVISNTYQYDDSEIKGDIENIEKLIPAQATEQNKLADKDFVNSTVASSAANFRGLWNTWADVPTNVDDYPEDYVGNKKPTHNDYLTVIDASDYVGLEAQQYRFYYIGDWDVLGKSGWTPQYKIGVNFTAAQQAAIDSGITASKVAEIDTKQNILTAGNGITINNDVISAEMDIIDVTGSQTISPNKLYVFGTVDSAITITKGTDVQNKVNCYCVRFTIATGGTVTFDGFGTIKWNGSSNQPTFKVGKTYELNIENGYAFYGEF